MPTADKITHILGIFLRVIVLNERHPIGCCTADSTRYCARVNTDPGIAEARRLTRVGETERGAVEPEHDALHRHQAGYRRGVGRVERAIGRAAGNHAQRPQLVVRQDARALRNRARFRTCSGNSGR